jgi:hypothetical protein
MTRDADREDISKRDITLKFRVLLYLIPWLCTVAAFFFSLYPESAHDTAQSPLEQALRLPFWTPLLATLGLAEGFWRMGLSHPIAGVIAALCLLVHAGIMLSNRRLAPLIGLLAIQVMMLGIAVAGFVHLSKLPWGG